MSDHVSELSAAVKAGDADAVQAILDRYPELKTVLDAPMAGAPFDQQALLIAVNKGNRASSTRN